MANKTVYQVVRTDGELTNNKYNSLYIYKTKEGAQKALEVMISIGKIPSGCGEIKEFEIDIPLSEREKNQEGVKRFFSFLDRLTPNSAVVGRVEIIGIHMTDYLILNTEELKQLRNILLKGGLCQG